MAEVTAALVKELRDKTGAGMMDCKRALGDSGGDIEAAVDWLRKKGLAAAAKKSGRVAAEGLVGVATRGAAGAVVEVNSETDFVARNELFQAFVRTVAALAVGGNGDVEAVKEMAYPGTGRTAAAESSELVGRVGANLGRGRVERRAQVLGTEANGRAGKAVEAAAKEADKPIRVAAFARFALGEGIERPPSDFAAEVGAQLKT